MEGTGNDLCQNLVFASPHRNSNSKHVTQCVMGNVGGLTAVEFFGITFRRSLTGTQRWVHPRSISLSFMFWSNSKEPVVSSDSAPWRAHKSWLCRYWASVQTEPLLLPGFLHHKTFKNRDLPKEQLRKENHCQPYRATPADERPLPEWQGHPAPASHCSLISQQRLKKTFFSEYIYSHIPNADAHGREVIHTETTASICASDSHSTLSKILGNTLLLSEGFKQKFHQFHSIRHALHC